VSKAGAMNGFMGGVIVGVSMVLLMILAWKLLRLYSQRHYCHYWFSLSAFKLDVILGKPLKLVEGRLYSERFSDISIRSSFSDADYIGSFDEGGEQTVTIAENQTYV
jgi:hypothetical protein